MPLTPMNDAQRQDLRHHRPDLPVLVASPHLNLPIHIAEHSRGFESRDDLQCDEQESTAGRRIGISTKNQNKAKYDCDYCNAVPAATVVNPVHANYCQPANRNRR